MLKRMQERYAGKPVKFLLTPCNQFANQEPGSNAEIKAFAEQSVTLGPGSNVVMLAKSNLNDVACATGGEGVCSPTSADCCPANDAVYDYLLSATPPGTIKWNFDKIITDVEGRPYDGETIFHGGDLDDKLGPVIDGLLAKNEQQQQAKQVQGILMFASVPSVPEATDVLLPATFACAFLVLGAWGFVSSRQRGGLARQPLLEEGAYDAISA